MKLKRFLLAGGGATLILITAVVAQQSTSEPTTNPSGVFDRLLGPDSALDAPPIAPTPPPGQDRTTGNAAVAPGAQQRAVSREGTYIPDRVGRLTRAADGNGYEFVLDADGQAMQDPPLRVLENLKLGLMEDAIATKGRDLRFRITGMLTEYRGRNYVLIEKVVEISEEKKAF
jgi:hypothetical protein